MPLYSYKCKDCGGKFDCLVFSEKDKLEVKCNKCESKNIEKLLSTFGLGSTGSNCAAST